MIKPPSDSSNIHSFDSSENESTIIITDDDVFMRLLLKRQLEKQGYHVLEANDGLQALKLMRISSPDLLISDWMMPEMDGIELCAQCKEDPDLEHIHIIMTTSKEKGEDLVKALDAGADDYLRKPWDEAELLARVRVGLRIGTLQKNLALRNEEFTRLNRQMGQEMDILKDIQKAMLPQVIPQFASLEFTSWYFPSATSGGGDYYDIIQLDKDRIGVVIADVSGHGAPAMITMALLRQTVHIYAKQFDAPHKLLQALNRVMFEHLPTDKYATMHYSIIDTKTLNCHYSSAGHNPPFWYRAKKKETVLLRNCEGFPLKLVTPDATYEETEIQLEPGDKLVYYTDGIPECFNAQHQDYGMDRFENVINENARKSTPAQLKAEMIRDVMRFNDSQIPEDDLTIAILGVTKTSGPEKS